MANIIAIFLLGWLLYIVLPYALPALIVFVGFSIIYKHTEQEKIKKGIYNGSFIYYKDFEKRWLSMSGAGRSGSRDGFKYKDYSGCYIITIYRHQVTNGNWKSYENVYVGQSHHIHQRVHNHFNGRGNGNVYADIQRGKWVYVSFVKCEEYEMNSKEIELIALFDATNSYNKTRGGA